MWPDSSFIRRAVAAAALLLVAAAAALAHPGSIAYWRVAFDGPTARSQVLLDLEDVRRLAPQGAVAPDWVAVAQSGQFRDAIRTRFRIEVGGEAMPSQVVDARLLSSGLVEVRLEHAVPASATGLVLRATFHEITDDGHRVIARAERHGVVTSSVLMAAQPAQWLADAVSGPPPGARGAGRWGTSMLRLGIEHILTGYDHLVFLGCLLIAGGTWRSRVGIISAFTVAHSITLVLAGMRVVTPPERFVEAAIAVSIAYVAIENLVAEPGRARWPAAFGFGLVHGLGFAGLLDAFDLPAGQWLAAVLTFNLGVEVGQLVAMAIALPLLNVLSRSSWHAHVVRYGSSAVLGLAVIWFLERLS